jgi:hypothetical protein
METTEGTGTVVGSVIDRVTAGRRLSRSIAAGDRA